MLEIMFAALKWKRMRASDDVLRGEAGGVTVTRRAGAEYWSHNIVIGSVVTAPPHGRSLAARWPNRDPLGESGFQNLTRTNEPRETNLVSWMSKSGSFGGERINLYCFVFNSPVDQTDLFGLAALPPGWTGPGKPYDPSCNPFESPGPPNPCKAPDPDNCSKTVCMSCCTGLGVNGLAACAQAPHIVAQVLCRFAVAAAMVVCNQSCSSCPNP